MKKDTELSLIPRLLDKLTVREGPLMAAALYLFAFVAKVEGWGR